MLPGSAGATLFLLALIPGFLYLRRTHSVRPPSEATALQEALEVIAVGLMTTGTVIGVALLVWGSRFVEAFRVDVRVSADLRRAVLVGAAVLLCACIVAELGAWARRTTAKVRRYSTNVWESVFGDLRPGMVRHIAIELSDGRTFDGPLHAYTVLPGSDGARQIALKGPIRVSKPGEAKPIGLNYGYLVVDAAEVRFASVIHVPDGH